VATLFAIGYRADATLPTENNSINGIPSFALTSAKDKTTSTRPQIKSTMKYVDRVATTGR